MQLCHSSATLSATFDEPNLIGSAGLVPAVGLAARVGLSQLSDDWLTVPGSRGCAGSKVMSLVAGMMAGADSIDDMDVLRHGGMATVFKCARAPSTLGTFLRSFTFGHVRQLDAVAARTVINLAETVPGLLAGGEPVVAVDIDDTVVRVYGADKQGAEHGYTRIKGLNAQVATLTTAQAAPVILGARLRRGAAASGHGAVRLIRDAMTTAARAGVTGQILVRADSAYYRHDVISAVTRAGGWFSIAARQNRAVQAAIAKIGDDDWTHIDYPQAVLDSDTGELVTAAEIAEIDYTAFTSRRLADRVTARLIVRRIPERNAAKLAAAGQLGLFQVWRYHALFTNNPAPLVAAEATHRGHAIIEGVFADLKAGPLAHLPSKRFPANAAWLALATIAFSLTRAIGVAAGGNFTRAENATVRARLINTPARISRSARRQHLHLPTRWPWAHHWGRAWTAIMTT